MSFRIAPSPHGHVQRATSDVMRWVVLALLPGVIVQLVFFGWGVLFQLVLAISTAYVCEALCVQARDRAAWPVLKDNTALVTASLLALSIPPLTPWWVIVIGVIFAIVVVKHVYGGVGQNIFNPAMAGYVLLLVSFPVQMTSWLPPMQLSQYSLGLWDSLHVILFEFTPDGYSVEQLRTSVDGITMATPLDSAKTDLSLGYTASEALQKPIFSDFAGLGWQWLNLAYLAGGLLLIKLRIISWHIPLGLLLGLCVPALLQVAFAPDTSIGPLIHALSGATMLGAFFIATDPVSAATSNRGRLYFGLLIGVLVFLIRTWGGYPDAIAFAVLLANMCVPVIDKYTKPTAYGHRRES
ncbi:electron transport complex subunit RsxD [Idiomarina xiamenensis]|uniref:Ion-translocating oxidoreductase complex subunit D n=1 Tax=Idiomarina xiamenensis 10-D-4 TaxID=740709 RepID=K2KQX3_9GAMM|nr:electron transport complex subunit RsxD [Idiomarina xiamenensis]EKE79905.1 NADH:ubiquinone oxidoreductase subunit RnfD [Idiomarina xiamenensis 10-D-4]